MYKVPRNRILTANTIGRAEPSFAVMLCHFSMLVVCYTFFCSDWPLVYFSLTIKQHQTVPRGVCLASWAACLLECKDPHIVGEGDVFQLFVCFKIKLFNFNIHFEKQNYCKSVPAEFFSVFGSFRWNQHYIGSTHTEENTLDLVIARTTDRLISKSVMASELQIYQENLHRGF